jgi:hypothetical protein
MALFVGSKTQVSGYVTKEKFLKGRTLEEIEKTLGYHPGRLANGATFLKLDRVPAPGEFSLAGYSQVADHRATPPTGIDVDKVSQIAAASFATEGGDRLVKVFPAIGHDPSMANDDQYPPGAGCPQWKLTTKINATVVAVVSLYPGGRYFPAS